MQSTTTKFAPWYNREKDTPPMTFQTEHSNDTNLRLAGANNTPKSSRKKTISKIGFGGFSVLIHSILEAQDQEPSDLTTLAPQWRWTGEKLSTDSLKAADVYLLVDKTNNELNAVIKIYRTKLNQTAQQSAQRERTVLEKLKGEYRIILIVCNRDMSLIRT
jgi:hypothetical protein